MARSTNEHRLPGDVGHLLAAVRAQISRYVWLEGLGATCGAIGLAFWVLLAIDWTFEPAAWIRLGLLFVALAGVGFVAYRRLLSRAFVRFPDRSLALLIERHFPQFHDSLVTAVELSSPQASAAPIDAEMLQRTCREAQALARGVDVRAVFDPAPRNRALAAGSLALLSLAIFALLAAGELGVFARRTVLLSDELWPRRTHLEIDGFPGGMVKVARGGDLDIVVKADTKMVVPSVVQVRYRSSEGVRGWANMSRQGEARTSQDPFQQFAHKFQGLLTPLEFEVLGGDDRLRDLRIEVVDSPSIAEMSLDCVFPAYTHRPPRVLPVTGVMQIPRGTEIVVRARANKPLVRVTVEEPVAGDPSTGGAGLLARDVGVDRDDPRAFAFPLGRLDSNRTLMVTLDDQDGIRSREPVRLAITAVQDEIPRLAVRPRGVGTSVTPAVRIPIVGEIKDDYGIARTWINYVIDERPAVEQAFAKPPRERAELSVEETLDAGPFELQPGQKLALSAHAADTFALTETPNIGTSERFEFEIVTPEQLLALLESRELNLRRRFEQLLDEVTESRDSLRDITFAETASAAATTDDATAAEPAAEEVEEPVGDTPERSAERRKIRTERAIQNGRKNASETRGVAVAFTDIHEELTNNRVDTPEMMSRLMDGIARPLTRVADEMFVELDRRLLDLQRDVDNAATGPERLAAAEQQADAILLEMQRVLDKMLELETFNEVVAMLRSIIDEQKDVNEATRDLRKQKVRDLLDD
ncbi:MAG: hypothetical protein KF708_05160 [Pirellulales bacterium]|nr:hypothetical protein [Pirellulales bacterium]